MYRIITLRVLCDDRILQWDEVLLRIQAREPNCKALTQMGSDLFYYHTEAPPRLQLENSVV